MDNANLSGRRLWVMAKGYTPDEGGMQTYAQGVAEAYAAMGAQVTVFTQTSAGPRRERVGNVLLVDIGPGKSALVLLRFLRAMSLELRRSGPPVLVHGTTWRTSVLPMLMRLPYVTSFHGREFMYARGLVLRVMRSAARRALRVVAVSHYSAGRLTARLEPDPPEVIVAWNGLSGMTNASLPQAADVRPVKGRRPMLFSLCRLEPRKNIASAVQACAAAKANGYDFRYVIGGRGPELERITALVRELGLDDCVEVAGFIPQEQIQEYYAVADIFLHPQVEEDGGRDFEGFGITIADAMAACTAVIVGADGGARELVENEKSGLIVDGRDVAMITAALETLLDDEHKRRSMARLGQERAEHYFTWRRHVSTIIDGLEMFAAA